MAFEDHFSRHAELYAASRPTYPPELFAWLASLTPSREAAWDAGAGSGQASIGLAPHFARVIATDASAEQIAQARPLANVEYRVAPAESSGLPDHSVDLTIAAQAVHWFDLPAYYAEIRRVVRPGGVAAVWCYHLNRIDPSIDPLLEHFDQVTLAPFWPARRKLLWEHLATIGWPFGGLTPPQVFEMRADWSLRELLEYLESSSAVQRSRQTPGQDALEAIRDELTAAWGDAAMRRRVTWPLHLQVGFVCQRCR